MRRLARWLPARNPHSLDAKTGLLTEVSSASALPADTKLVPGAARPSPGRNVDNDIWASDLHLTPDGKFLYAAERTSSSLGAFSVDVATGKLTYLSSTCLLYTSPSPRDRQKSRMPSSA